MGEPRTEPAPEIVMEADGIYWRRHSDDSWSMVPVSTRNEETRWPIAVYRLVGWEEKNGTLRQEPEHG